MTVSEQTIAATVAGYLEAQGFEVFEEVTLTAEHKRHAEGGVLGDARADLVGRRGSEIIVVECKRAITFELLGQGPSPGLREGRRGHEDGDRGGEGHSLIWYGPTMSNAASVGDVDIILTVESIRDGAKHSVAVLRRTRGRVRIDHVVDRLRPDYERWVNHGLIELIGPPGKKDQRITKPTDPVFLERVRDYVAKYNFTGTITQVAAEPPPP